MIRAQPGSSEVSVELESGGMLQLAGQGQHPGRRKPIGQPAIAYIESCGGAVWK